MLRNSFVFISIFACIHTSIAYADGLKFDASKDTIARFELSSDAIAGTTLKDNNTKLEWMRCAVNQDFDPSKKPYGFDGQGACKNNPAEISYAEAEAFAKKVGHGWRIPSIFELEAIGDGTREILIGFDNTYKYDSWGGRDGCNQNWGLWSDTGVVNEAGLVNVYRCESRTMNQPMQRYTTRKGGDSRYSLLLVRDFGAANPKVEAIQKPKKKSK